MKIVYDADGWISVHPQKQHIEFTYPMLSILYGLPGSCWKTLGFMMQTCYRYDEVAADYVRGPRSLSVRYIAEGTLQDPSTVVTALETLRRWRLALLVAEGSPAAPGRDGEAAVWTVNWHLRVRPVDDEAAGGWFIEGVEEPFIPRAPRACRGGSVRKIHTPERAENPSVRKIPTLPEGEACGKSVQRSEDQEIINKHAGDLKRQQPSAPSPTPPSVRIVTNQPLSELERQGYPAEPPTTAGRYPTRPPLLPHTPLSLRAMELSPDDLRRLAAEPLDSLYAPGRFHQGERGVPLGREEALRLWMLAMLGVVCGVALRTGLDDSAAAPLWPLACDLLAENVSPPRLWLAFGDPAGYWQASEEHAWKRRRPTVAEVKTFWAAALEWRPAAAAANGQNGGRPTAPRPSAEVLARAEAGWNALQDGIRRFSNFREDELLATLDAPTRAALKTCGGLSRIRHMNVQYESGQVKRQFISEYQSAAARLAAAERNDAPASTSTVREPLPVYAAA